jgi:dinuclear metal center YbgI/SA1388 family protein
MTKIKEVSKYIDNWAPLDYQEDYDNAGLITGNEDWEIKAVLISLDVTEEVVLEAKTKGANLIISHHPIVFKSIKKITGKNYVERTILLAIKNDIAIYACHTNLDHITGGVNWKIASKLNLKNVKVLCPKKNTLSKLVTFVPVEDKEKVKAALFEAGAGTIGNYNNCSFETEGIGSFKPGDDAKPVIGNRYIQEYVNESRIEVILPTHLQNDIIEALKIAHPYEEVAFYLSKIENYNQDVGAGAIGELEAEMEVDEFLEHVKTSMDLKIIKFTPLNKKIKKVALCGGAGSFLLKDAIRSGADAFVTSDFKYHEFFDADNKILIADIGHYESEVFTKELIHFQLSNKFSNFASLLSETQTNPVKYFY